jgi:hypothetical protein
MRRVLRITAICALILVFLTLAACGTLQGETPVPAVAMPLGTPEVLNGQTTLVNVMTQEQNNANNQAVATAEIVRADAQATLSSANATLNAAQIQQQNNADDLAAQLAATAVMARANAQATLVAASSTQSAAQTQDAFRQTQVQEQKNRDAIAAATQTSVANLIATQTQSAIATSQWYADQSRQREEQIQGSITFLWMWCLPLLVILLVGLGLWGLWRWIKSGQKPQLIAGEPVEKLQSPLNQVNPQERFLPPGNDIIDDPHPHPKPDEQMRRWMDEIKGKLVKRGKDEDDNPDG